MAWLPRRWADLLALVGIAVVALAADYIIGAASRATAVTVGCCMAYVGIVSDGDWMAGWWAPVPLLVMGWLTFIIGYRALLSRAGMVKSLNRDQDARDDALLDDLIVRVAGRQERAITDGFRSIWPRIQSSWSLPAGTTFMNWRRTPAGGRVSVRTPGDSAGVIKAAPTIAARTGLPRNAVTVTGDSQDNSVAHINFTTRDPLGEVVKWTPPVPGSLSVAKGTRLARLVDGSTMMLPIRETHVRVCGMTRSGKTQTILVTMADLIAMPDARIIVIELAKQASDYVRFWPHAWMVATTPEDAVTALERLMACGVERSQYRAQHNVSGTHIPTPAQPQYVVVIDEAPTAFAYDGKKGTPNVAGLLFRLALESSGWGTTLIAGITNPHGDVLPTTARRQFGTKVAHAGDDRVYHKLVFDQEPVGDLDASLLPFQTGHALVKRTTDRSPRLARVLYATEPELDAYAATVPPVDHVFPHPHYRPQTPPPADTVPEPEGALVVEEPEPYAGPHLVPDLGPDPDELTGSARTVYDAVAAINSTGGRPRKADLIRQSGLSDKTVGKVLERLIEDGYVALADAPGSTARFYRTTRSAA
jgi:hypothetical protein